MRIHSGNGEHDDMDRRAIDCFDQALDDVGLSADERLRQALHDYFAWATTTTMARYPESPDDVPDGLSIPQWSWTDRSPAKGRPEPRGQDSRPRARPRTSGSAPSATAAISRNATAG